MDIKEYSRGVCEYIDNLTDEEFDQLLSQAGIENCPMEEGLPNESWTSNESPPLYLQQDLYVFTPSDKENLFLDMRVA